MKIISSVHDFYDGTCKSFHDDIVWERDTQCLYNEAHLTSQQSDLLKECQRVLHKWTPQKYYSLFKDPSGVLMLYGKIYPFKVIARHFIWSKPQLHSMYDHFIGTRKADTWARKAQLAKEARKKDHEHWNEMDIRQLQLVFRSSMQAGSPWYDWENTAWDEVYTDLLAQARSPMLLWSSQPVPAIHPQHEDIGGIAGPVAYCNPAPLKSIDFHKAADAYAIYNSVSMFLGGVLTNSENIVHIQDDEVIRDSKGFGECSFKSCGR